MSNNSKYRVFELAKEYHTSSKDIMELLSKNEVPVKNHMSNVDEKGIDLVRKHLVERSPPADAGSPPQRSYLRQTVLFRSPSHIV